MPSLYHGEGAPMDMDMDMDMDIGTNANANANSGTGASVSWSHPYQPVSRGKVLPTGIDEHEHNVNSDTLAADDHDMIMENATNTTATPTTTTTTTATATTAAWRVRDTAEQLLAARRNLLTVETSSSTAVKSSSSSSNKKMHLSSVQDMHVQTNSCLARIQRDKAVTVQVAFSTAARAVLTALQVAEYTAAAASTHTNSQSMTAVPPERVPSYVRQWQQLQDMRQQSLTRSHENKEYTKKKGAKVDVDLILHQHQHQQHQHQQQPEEDEQVGENKKEPMEDNSESTSTLPSATKVRSNSNISSTSSSKLLDSSGSAKKQGTAAAGTKATSITSSTDYPKFTRNTPASSAAALDFRFNSSRAILCAAGNVAFDVLTPDQTGHELDVLCVPQNPSYKKGDETTTQQDTTAIVAVANAAPDATTSTAAAAAAAAATSTTTSSSSNVFNMGAVVVEAQTLAQRTISVAQNAVHRSTMRYQYRKDNARYDCDDKDFLKVPNPFSWKPNQHANASQHAGNSSNGGGSEGSSAGNTTDEDEDQSDNAMEVYGNEQVVVARGGAIPHRPNPNSITDTWQSLCLPRFLDVLQKGAGHAVYHDVQWSDRHGRIADLLRALSRVNNSDNAGSANGNDTDPDEEVEDNSNMGPHLIVTTEPDVTRFAQEFHDMSNHVRLITTNESKSLNVLAYTGSKKRRRNLRRYFSKGTGLPEAPYHVIVTSYASFLEDYFHFCQLPFEVVVLDDGVSWMAAAQGDQNSAIGSIWDGAIWSENDHQVGLAGTGFKPWDFTQDKLSEAMIKEAWIGLTARHRVMTSSILRIQQRQSLDLVPVSGIVDFVAPHFSDVVREEWDRSKIASDASSMEHFRQLVARSIIVHHAESPERDTHTLALLALKGNLPSSNRSYYAPVPRVVTEDEFISKGMVAFSRRSCLLWLGAPEKSWLRYELGKTSVRHILDAMKITNNHGAVCEEITTASSTTSSGATGQVAGTMAYRLAVRCGRYFGSEQGLRQHISALHAPPGTWLCRTCAIDCNTSQARTHHERSCGQSSSTVSGDQNGSVGATPTVGQGGPAKAGVGKKKGKASQPAPPGEEKDPDGAFRVPGFRGVWLNTSGKHFIKVDGERLTSLPEGKGDLVFFGAIDEAAKKYDSILRMQKKKNHNQKMELNFKPDGTRFLYEDITPASTSGLGGSAANVVPALSVINIKDLPPAVKPLLRDPRQTSRTGGNSKRHVYAYRGVCRQARKGHDRWQSQISFMGVNHYLGTFDSEWDAAAIYAWAHLILYGEEATRQAQQEGEEAAAAYEQEKRDIASGKIPEPAAAPQPEKKKKKKEKKEKATPTTPKSREKRAGPDGVQSSGKATETKKRKTAGKTARAAPSAEKKPKSAVKTTRLETIAPVIAKGVTKAPILAPREAFDGIDDSELTRMASVKLVAARGAGYRASEAQHSLSGVEAILRPCIALSSYLGSAPVGGAMLLGLSPSHFGWDIEEFISTCDLNSEQATMTAIQMLAVEYDEGGVNAEFQSVIQSTVCIVGNASTRTQKLYKSLGLGSIPIGGTVGELDCHIGGVPGSCSERAACIAYAPTTASEFQFCCLSDDDMVTLNGKRITVEMGCFPLLNEDICTVGARVFVFLVP